MPEQSTRSRIDDRHFGVYRPIDSNALLFLCMDDEQRIILLSCLPLSGKG
jgi:hypothetical protein